MYLLAQKFKHDLDGYPIYTISHLHDGTKFLCGTKIKTSNVFYNRGDLILKDWLIKITTCKKCKEIANKRLNKILILLEKI